MPTRPAPSNQPQEQYTDLHFPKAGVDTSGSFGDQPNRPSVDRQYARTTVDAENVSAFCVFTGRARGGSRPPLARWVATQVNGSEQVQNLCSAVVTTGAVPGSGSTVSTYFGMTGIGLAPFSVYTYDDVTGLKKDDGTALFGTSGGHCVSARAFISGGSNPSYTSLSIADSTGVTVALSPMDNAGVASYTMAVNGKRFASAPFILPGTSVPLVGTATICLSSASYHIVAALQGGASEGVLMVCGIDDSGSVNWSKSDVVTTSETLNVGGYYTYNLGAAITGTYLCVNSPGATGVVRCLLADGTSGSVITTNASITTMAGAGYTNAKASGGAITQSIAATSAGVLAVTVEGQVAVDGVLTNVGGLAFITASTGASAFTAVTALTTTPSIPATAGTGIRQAIRVISDGTHFYVCVTARSLAEAGYLPVIKKINGATGAVLWTATLTKQQNDDIVLVYASGLGRLEVYGYQLSTALNASTGAVIGAGTLPGNYRWTAIDDAGSITLGAESVTEGTTSGPRECLYGVAGGTIKVAYGGSFRSVSGGSGILSNFTAAPVIRAVEAFGYIYYLDGVNWVRVNPGSNLAETWTATVGTLPSDDSNLPRLGCLWNSRLVLSGISSDPRNWFMSAIADPTDWEYGPLSPSVADATAGSDGPLGKIGDVVTALIPYRDDVLIFGGLRSIYMLSGNPLDGGKLELQTTEAGIAFGNAWCMDPFGAIYFLSNYRGVFRYVPGEQPIKISQQIDDLLRAIDLRTQSVRLQWDDQYQTVRLFATPFGSTAAPTLHFNYEARAQAWFPMRFGDDDLSPLASYTFEGNTTGEHAALIGSRNGYVYSFSAAASDDDGTAVSSRVLIGPFVTKFLDDVFITDMQAVLAEDSGIVTWEILSADTPEGAVDATEVSATGTVRDGRNLTDLLKTAAHAHYIRLTATTPWAMEQFRLRWHATKRTRMRGP